MIARVSWVVATTLALLCICVHAQQQQSADAPLVSQLCLGCICEVTSGCNTTIGCSGSVCGPFAITWGYWADAGKPTLNGEPLGDQSYSRCTNDPYCAATTIQGYMAKFGQDCTGNGVIDCDDYLRIHRLGGYGCTGPDNASNIDNIHLRLMNVIKNGVNAALLYGVKLSCPVINVGVKLELRRSTSDTMVSAAASQCIRKLTMRLEIVVPQEYSSNIIADLTRKRADIQQVDMRSNNKVIGAFVPLSKLLGYSTTLRIVSLNNATFSLEFSYYPLMTTADKQEAIEKFQGF